MSRVNIPSAVAMRKKAHIVRTMKTLERGSRSKFITLERAVIKIEEASERGNTWLDFRGVSENYEFVKRKLEEQNYLCRIDPNEREPVLHVDWTNAE